MFVEQSGLFLLVVLDRFHLADQVLHNGIADAVALRLVHLGPGEHVVAHVVGLGPVAHQLLQVAVGELAHVGGVLDEEQRGGDGALHVVGHRGQHGVVHDDGLRRRQERADLVAELHAAEEAVHGLVGDDGVVEREERAGGEGVAVHLVQVRVVDGVHVRVVAEHERRHVVLRADAGARQHHRVDRVLRGGLAGGQVRQVLVVRVVQRACRLGDGLRVSRAAHRHVDHLADAAGAVEEQRVVVVRDLLAHQAALHRLVALRDVHRQVVVVLVVALRAHVRKRDLALSAAPTAHRDRLQQQRRQRVVGHRAHVDAGALRGAQLSVLHEDGGLRGQEVIDLLLTGLPRCHLLLGIVEALAGEGQLGLVHAVRHDEVAVFVHFSGNQVREGGRVGVEVQLRAVLQPVGALEVLHVCFVASHVLIVTGGERIDLDLFSEERVRLHVLDNIKLDGLRCLGEKALSDERRRSLHGGADGIHFSARDGKHERKQ